MRAAVWGGSIRPPLPRQLPCHRRVNLFADRTATAKESQLGCKCVCVKDEARQTDLQIVHQIMAGALAAAIYLLMRKSEFCLHPPLHDLALNLPPSVARAEMATCYGLG
ncbi:hypothetical protein C0Q70_08155 [Pomacea canaliculata]|uniref:Uncharacterized protein n=1 Tax=Pomacea canaliculata TaxID=400727 RepID=A0A2T7PH50_POMCA|nr:hypothetical protein C0Q70_08155 [Pomacea canaliculata]